MRVRRGPVLVGGLDLEGTAAADANWCVDTIESSGGTWTLAGWAVSSEGRPETLEIGLNGRRCETRWSGRSDVATLFPGRTGSAEAGFSARAAGKGPRPDLRRPLRLSLLVDGEEKPSLDYFYPGDKGIVPPPENRRRVHGGDVLPSYLLEGCSAFVKIERVLTQACGRTYRSFTTILDWGVGCGRFSRYFEPDRRSAPGSLIGIDIDGVNVQWCKHHMPWMQVDQVDVSPPTSLGAGIADLVIGVSVFTHLREPDMFAWLEEMQRLVRPGGLVAVTTHGRTTFSRSGLGQEFGDRLEVVGYLDAGENPDIPGATPDAGYYRNVFHTEEYIRSVWGRFFTVVAVVPGLIGNHQDLVVLQRS